MTDDSLVTSELYDDINIVLQNVELSATKNTKPHFCVVCDECFFHFPEPGRFFSHACQGTRIRPGNFCINNHDLGGHHQGHLEDKPRQFNCDFCGKSFLYKHSLKVHLKVHLNDRPHKCAICQKAFVRKSDLHSHLRSHTGEKPFRCEICGKMFSRKANLKVHMNIHTGKKPFQCDFCDKTFSRKEDKLVHVRSHTGERPFGCEVCGKKFASVKVQKIHLARHQKNKQGSKHSHRFSNGEMVKMEY